MIDRRDRRGVEDSTCLRVWTSDISAVVHGECWRQPHQQRLIQHRLNVFQVTASDFGVDRRSSVKGGQQDSLESSPLSQFSIVCVTLVVF